MYFQMLAGVCSSLFYVLALLTQTRGKKEKQTNKQKSKKATDQLRLSDPAPSCSQLVNRQWGWQQLPDPAPGYYVLLKVSLRVGQ
jgi:hypothetical protein